MSSTDDGHDPNDVNISDLSFQEVLTELARGGAVEGPAVGYAGSPSRQYALYERLRSVASNDDLEAAVREHKEPCVQVYAFEALCSRGDPRVAELAFELRNVRTSVHELYGCIGSSTTVGEKLGGLALGSLAGESKETYALRLFRDNPSKTFRVVRQWLPRSEEVRQLLCKAYAAGIDAALPMIMNYKRDSERLLMLALESSGNDSRQFYALRVLETRPFPKVWRQLEAMHQAMVAADCWSNSWGNYYAALLVHMSHGYNVEEVTEILLRTAMLSPSKVKMASYHAEFLANAMTSWAGKESPFPAEPLSNAGSNLCKTALMLWQNHSQMSPPLLKLCLKDPTLLDEVKVLMRQSLTCPDVLNAISAFGRNVFPSILPQLPALYRSLLSEEELDQDVNVAVELASVHVLPTLLSCLDPASCSGDMSILEAAFPALAGRCAKDPNAHVVLAIIHAVDRVWPHPESRQHHEIARILLQRLRGDMKMSWARGEMEAFVSRQKTNK